MRISKSLKIKPLCLSTPLWTAMCDRRRSSLCLAPAHRAPGPPEGLLGRGLLGTGGRGDRKATEQRTAVGDVQKAPFLTSRVPTARSPPTAFALPGRGVRAPRPHRLLSRNVLEPGPREAPGPVLPPPESPPGHADSDTHGSARRKRQAASRRRPGTGHGAPDRACGSL